MTRTDSPADRHYRRFNAPSKGTDTPKLISLRHATNDCRSSGPSADSPAAAPAALPAAAAAATCATAAARLSPRPLPRPSSWPPSSQPSVPSLHVSRVVPWDGCLAWSFEPVALPSGDARPCGACCCVWCDCRTASATLLARVSCSFCGGSDAKRDSSESTPPIALPPAPPVLPSTVNSHAAAGVAAATAAAVTAAAAAWLRLPLPELGSGEWGCTGDRHNGGARHSACFSSWVRLVALLLWPRVRVGTWRKLPLPQAPPPLVWLAPPPLGRLPLMCVPLPARCSEPAMLSVRLRGWEGARRATDSAYAVSTCVCTQRHAHTLHGETHAHWAIPRPRAGLYV